MNHTGTCVLGKPQQALKKGESDTAMDATLPPSEDAFGGICAPEERVWCIWCVVD
jgi:hypothetical protein